MFWTRNSVVICIGFVAGLFCPAPAAFAENGGEIHYEAEIVDLPLRTALTVLGRDLGVEFTIDGADRRRIRDLRLSGNGEEAVAALMEAAGMDAFAFNGQVFVSPIEARGVRLVRLDDVGADAALDALDAAGLLDPAFSVSAVADGSALVLSGPVKFLALSEGVVSSLRASPVDESPQVRVRKAGKLVSDDAGGVSVSSASQ